MSSNFVKSLSLLLSLSFFGCQNFTNDKPREKSNLEIAASETKCIDKIGDQFSDSFDPDKAMSSSELQAPFNCVNEALVQFLKYTKGKSQNHYTPDELRNFFETFFLSDKETGEVTRPISNGLLGSIMHLKAILTGGDREIVTRDEISKLMGFIDIVKVEYAAINPHLKLFLTEDLKEKNDKKSLKMASKEAQMQFEKTANTIAEYFETSGSDFSTEDLKQFFNELNAFSDDTLLENSDSWAELFDSIKNVFVNPEPGILLKADWSKLFKTLGPLSQLAIHAVAELNFSFEDQDVESIVTFVDRATDEVGKGLSLREEKLLSFEEVTKIISHLFELEILDESLGQEVLTQTFESFFKRLLAGWNSVPAEEVTGFTFADLRRFYSEARNWGFSQSLINQVEDGTDLNAVFEQWRSVELTDEELIATRDLLIEAVSSSEPIKINDNGFVLDKKEVRQKTNIASLSQQNLVRVGLQWVHIAYVDNPERRFLFEGLLKDEFVGFFDSIWQLLVNLEIFDGRGGSIGSRLFFESDLLSFSANGDGKMQNKEFAGIIMNLLATGSDMSKRIKTELVKRECEDPQYTDHKGTPLFLQECFEKNVLSASAQEMPAMPFLKDYFETSNNSPEAADVLSKTLVSIGKSSLSCPTGIEYGDLQQAMVISTYSEMTFMKYDADGDGLLNHKEVNKAFPVYKKILADLSGIDSNFKLKVILKYILKTGNNPLELVEEHGGGEEGREAAASIMGRAVFIGGFEIPRQKIINAFGAIKKMLASAQEDADGPSPYDSCKER